MRNQDFVVKLLLVAIVATVCVWAWPDRAESRDPDRRERETQRKGSRGRPEHNRDREGELDRRRQEHRRRQEMEERQQIEHLESLERMMEMHKRLSEIFDDAPISGLMAINKIKDIAAHTGELDQGIDALERIADDSPVLGLRQAALISMHELQLADKDPQAAMNSLVRVCLEFDDDDDDDDDDDN